jgi:hypothetical protein
VNAPEGRAREIEWRGRSHRLREAALLALRPRRAGAAMESGRPGQPGWQRTSHSSSLPARPGTSVPRRVNSSSHDRSRSWYSDSRHSSNGEQPRSPGSPSDILQFTGGWSRVGRQRDMQWSSGHGLRATVFGPRSSGYGLRASCMGRWALSSTDGHTARCARTEGTVWMQDRDAACNQANPMIGCRVQQTCTACVEQAAEVVRNGTGGTSPGLAFRGRRLAMKSRW